MMRIEHLVARLAQRHARSALAATRLQLGSSIAQTQQQFAVGFATHASSSSGRKNKKQSPPQSFAIAEAFEGLDDDDDASDDDGSSNSNGDTQRRGLGDSRSSAERDVSREFLLAMEKKKSWMQALAQQRQYDAIVKAVYDCYAPLYALPAAAALVETSALLTQHFAGARVETKYQPQLFSATLTNITEQEALALLVVARKGALARAVFDHRRTLAAQLAATPIVVGASDSSASVLDDAVQAPLDLTRHLRSFFSWGMGAYSLAHDYDAMLALYDDALAANVYPTASMNASYVRALVTLRRPAADVLAFYKNVLEHARPTNVFFYRQLLFFASVHHDTGLLLTLLDDMKIKGFKLRADDYEHAIKAFDDRYYLTPRKRSAVAASPRSATTRPDTAQPLTTPLDTYASCMTRLREFDDDPEAFHDLDAAAHSVVALFDEMADDERLVPTSDHVFPRVIAAAVYAREFRKALAYVALFETHYPNTPLPHAGVRMAVNAHLLLDEPAQAWAFVCKTYSAKRFEQREYAHVANILEYLCLTNNVSELLHVLDDAQTMRILPLFSNSTVKILLPALVRSSSDSGLSDEALWDLVCRFESVFRVRSKPHAFAQFVNECVFRKRFGAAKRALKQRDPRRVGALKARVGVRVMAAFAAAGDHAFVPEVLRAVDVATATPDELAALVFAVVRAHERLGRSRDESTRLFKKHIAPLVASGKVTDVPADVAAAVDNDA